MGEVFFGLLTVECCPIQAGAGLGSYWSPVLQAQDNHYCLHKASWDESKSKVKSTWIQWKNEKLPLKMLLKEPCNLKRV